MNNDQLIETAKRWLELWRNPETCAKMDAVLRSLPPEDQMLIVRIGQRMQLNLPIVKIEPLVRKSCPASDEGE